MAAVSLCGLTAILGYAAFRLGGVYAGDWLKCLFAIGLTAALFSLAASKASCPPPLPAIVRWLLAALLAVCFLQNIPLPLAVVEVLSPLRAELATATAPLLGKSAWLSLSVAPPETARLALTVLGYVLVFLIVRRLCWRWSDNPWHVSLPFVVVAFLEGVLGLVQVYTGEGQGLARGTYVNRNHYAGLLALALPFALMHGLAIFRRGRKGEDRPIMPAVLACLLLGTAAVLLLGILLSLSRMGLLATLASLFVMGALALGVGRLGWRRWLPVSAVGALVVSLFLLLPTDQLIARFADLTATEEVSSDMRAEVWRETLAVVEAYPLVGCGLGAYEPAFMRFKEVAPMNRVDFAHNDYLQVLAESGVFGFAVLLSLALYVFGRTIRRSTEASNPDRRYMALAASGALAAILLHSLVDFNLYIPANGMLVAWIGGIAMAASPSRRIRQAGFVVEMPLSTAASPKRGTLTIDVLPEERQDK